MTLPAAARLPSTLAGSGERLSGIAHDRVVVTVDAGHLPDEEEFCELVAMRQEEEYAG